MYFGLFEASKSFSARCLSQLPAPLFFGGDYGIIIPRDSVEIPDKLYHVTSEKNLDNILKKESPLLAVWFFSQTAFRTLRTISNGNKFTARIGIEYFC